MRTTARQLWRFWHSRRWPEAATIAIATLIIAWMLFGALSVAYERWSFVILYIFANLSLVICLAILVGRWREQ